MRRLSLTDQILVNFQEALTTIRGKSTASTTRDIEFPAETELDTEQKKHVAGLMRVNHAGEVCAQALYQGQALVARSEIVREKMQTCADEEIDHLIWCQQRLNELESHVSYLGWFWYTGALTIGVIAGLAGDKWSLGFLAETEKQVGEHLKGHLNKMPQSDKRTQAILNQMAIDESSHENLAHELGAAELPGFIKKLMKYNAKVMTTLAYYV